MSAFRPLRHPATSRLLARRTLRGVAPVLTSLAVAGALAACSSDTVTEPTSLAGTYQATTLRALPTGGDDLDLLAEGVSLTLVIAADNSTTGTLTVPGDLTENGEPATQSMNGSAVRTGNTVRFQQSADSFVRDLVWTVGSTTLSVNNQTAGGAAFTITLTRR